MKIGRLISNYPKDGIFQQDGASRKTSTKMQEKTQGWRVKKYQTRLFPRRENPKTRCTRIRNSRNYSDNDLWTMNRKQKPNTLRQVMWILRRQRGLSSPVRPLSEVLPYRQGDIPCTSATLLSAPQYQWNDDAFNITLISDSTPTPRLDRSSSHFEALADLHNPKSVLLPQRTVNGAIRKWWTDT